MPDGCARRPQATGEYSILYTATLCLLAFGAVMVYSASSAESLLSGTGDPSFYLKRYLMCGVIGLVVMHAASRHGLKVVKALTPILLIASFVLTAAVMLPGVGVTVNGATRWLGAGPLQFQPSELLKVVARALRGPVAGRPPTRHQDAQGPVQPAADRGRGWPACCCSSSPTWARRW